MKLEYDTSDYSQKQLVKKKCLIKQGIFLKLIQDLTLPLNYQLDVTKRDKIDFSLGFVRGNTFYANLAAHSNLNFLGKPKYSATRNIKSTLLATLSRIGY